MEALSPDQWKQLSRLYVQRQLNQAGNRMVEQEMQNNFDFRRTVEQELAIYEGLAEAEDQLRWEAILTGVQELRQVKAKLNASTSADSNKSLEKTHANEPINDPHISKHSTPDGQKTDRFEQNTGSSFPKRTSGLPGWVMAVSIAGFILLLGGGYLFLVGSNGNIAKESAIKARNNSSHTRDSSVTESPDQPSIARNPPVAQPDSGWTPDVENKQVVGSDDRSRKPSDRPDSQLAVLVSTQPIILFVPEDTEDSFGLGSAEVPNDTLTARLYQVYGPAEYSFQGNILSLYLPKRLAQQPLKLRLSQQPDSTYRLRVNQTSFHILRGKRQLLR